MVGRFGAVAASWLVLAAVAGAALATPAGGSAAHHAGAGVVSHASAEDVSADPASIDVLQETDSTVTRIGVADDGNATWEVQIRTRLTSDADVEEYEAFQERFRENTSEFLDPFGERMRGVVAEASDETGRSMEARDFRAETTIQAVPRRWGVVSYEFQWAGFAARDGDGLVVGDVFRGQFFLAENDTLELTGPEGYAVTTADPEPAERDTRTVRWFGPRSFPNDTPAVRFDPVEPTQTTAPGTETAADTSATDGSDGQDSTDREAATDDPNGTAPPGETTGTSAPSDPGSGSLLPLAAAVLVGGLLAVGAYRLYAEDSGEPRDSDEPPAAPGSDAERADDRKSAAARGETDGESGASAAATDDAGSDVTGPVDPDPVVTDADRVERLLQEGGGQLRQSEIVEALDWSKSKTSRVLSDMADEDRVEKLRIGRENVIRFPEDDEFGGDSPDGGDELE